jgi:DNA-binding Lrp family transcriptional regulator
LSVVRAQAATPGAEASSEDAAVARVVARFSSEYVLRILQPTIEMFGDVRAALVAQSINMANTAHFDARNEWGRHAANLSITFPDQARRPISIARLADSADLPFESTRRIVQRLIDTGACARVDGGVIVQMATLQRPDIIRAVVENVGYVRRLVRDLEAVGLVANVPAGWTQTGPEAIQDTFDARVVARLSATYLLRALKLLDVYGDVRDRVIALTIVTANTAHLDARGGEGRRYMAIDQTPPDAVCRPISIARLADSLGLPFETTRRHVRRLMLAGVCVRVDGGLIVPQAVLDRPEVVQATLVNVGYVRKFVRDLHVAATGTPSGPRPH